MVKSLNNNIYDTKKKFGLKKLIISIYKYIKIDYYRKLQLILSNLSLNHYQEEFDMFG